MSARLTLESVIENVRTNNGWKFHSGMYRNNSSKLMWLVPECGHIIEMDYSHAMRKKGRGCTNCNRHLSQPVPIDKIRDFCKARNSELITEQYLNNQQALKVRCECGYEFFKSWQKLVAGQWCTNCKPKSNGEAYTRRTFEFLFQKSFLTTRVENPKFELDGYNEDLKLAFEYQGKQHYEYVPHISRTKNAHSHLVKNDIRKKKWCIDNNISFVEIPDFDLYLPNNEILKEFGGRCTKENLPALIRSQIPNRLKCTLDTQATSYSTKIINQHCSRLKALDKKLESTSRVLIDYDDTNANSDILIYCQKCDQIYTSRFKNIISQERKCRGCINRTRQVSGIEVRRILAQKGLKLVGPFNGGQKINTFQTPSGQVIEEIFLSVKNSSCYGDEFATAFQHRKSRHRLNKNKKLPEINAPIS